MAEGHLPLIWGHLPMCYVVNVDSWKVLAHENSGQVPDIISGGSFGIEGSVISLTLTILGTYAIYRYYTDGQQ